MCALYYALSKQSFSWIDFFFLSSSFCYGVFVIFLYHVKFPLLFLKCFSGEKGISEIYTPGALDQELLSLGSFHQAAHRGTEKGKIKSTLNTEADVSNTRIEGPIILVLGLISLLEMSELVCDGLSSSFARLQEYTC